MSPHLLAKHVLLDASSSPDTSSALDAPARAIAAGELVVFPTETVYGLGANALDPVALRKIFTAKRRPATNPLIVHVEGAEQARRIAASWPEQATKLIDAFWPGPLTLVLPKHTSALDDSVLLVPDEATAGRPNVALRMPAHPVALALIERAGVPICAPSANLYMSVSPTRAEHVLDSELADAVQFVLDAGPTRVGVESTVLSLLDGEPPVILRHGMITRSEIQAALGGERVYLLEEFQALQGDRNADASLSPEQDEPRGALSPGMAARHYAPRAPMTIADAMAPAMHEDHGAPIGILEHGARRVTQVDRFGNLSITLPDNAHAYARGLYDVFHRFDAHGVSHIYVLRPPLASREDREAWQAVHDRLLRASTAL